MSEPESAVDRLAAAFIDRTLPKAQWTHHAHLRVGLRHVLRHGPDRALDLLRDRIRAYNESVGGINDDQSGYHETITRLYVLLIDDFLSGRDRSAPVDELADAVVETLGAKDLPFRHYTKERLMSVEARRNWVEPDLRPIEAAAPPGAPSPV